MIRRDFLKYLGSLPILGFISTNSFGKTEKQPFANFALGKYLNHELDTKLCDSDMIFSGLQNSYYRPINFPIENRLTLNFENGSCGYVAFNTPIDLLRKIISMTGFELEKYLVENDKNTPKCANSNFIFEKYKFRLSYVSMKN